MTKTITGQGAVGQSMNLTTMSSGQMAYSAQGLFNTSPTISISSGFDTISLNLSDNHPAIKKYEVYESPEDVLALSVAWKRLRDNKQSFVSSLLHKDLFNNLTNQDKEKANIIRDYYSKKIMMLKLKDEDRITPFRNDLIHVIKNDGLLIKENMLGIIYYLPEFYLYDLDIDYIRSCVNINNNFKKLDSEQKPRSLALTCSLTPIKKIIKKRKQSTKIQYWLKDNTLNAGVLITLNQDNPLEHIWDHLFNTEKVLKIEGVYTRMKMDDFEYFSANKWKLVQG